MYTVLVPKNETIVGFPLIFYYNIRISQILFGSQNFHSFSNILLQKTCIRACINIGTLIFQTHIFTILIEKKVSYVTNTSSIKVCYNIYNNMNAHLQNHVVGLQRKYSAWRKTPGGPRLTLVDLENDLLFELRSFRPTIVPASVLFFTQLFCQALFIKILFLMIDMIKF